MSEPPPIQRAKVDIHIGAGPSETSVRLNDIDVTRWLTGVVVECRNGDLTKVTLELHRFNNARAHVTGALENVEVIDAPPDSAADPLASSGR
jgi:hypothetical protein